MQQMHAELDAKCAVMQLQQKETGHQESQLRQQQPPLPLARSSQHGQRVAPLSVHLPRLPLITAAALRAFSEERGFALGVGVYLHAAVGGGRACGPVDLFEVRSVD